MLFSSTLFLFAFLPVVLGLALVLPGVRARNGLLLAASLVFYAWGELGYVAILLGSIAMNFGFARALDAGRGTGAGRRVLFAAIVANLGLLGAFKYANFFADNLSLPLVALGLEPIALDPVHLPIGISFFTFQALTYVVDVYRNDAPVQRSPLRVALYISLFPQLIAGPIVRYQQVAAELTARSATAADVAAGMRRFVVGLGKKVIIANGLAVPADGIFAIPAGDLETSVAWLGIACYTLQIYYDFSGYSDMAIGLGRCFGFHFPENFDWPYLSGSIREFWRRWHISLSTWFRDYLYIPLGGNRNGALATGRNLLTVFLLCGLWHGASWSFVVWGLLHGVFLVLERGAFGAWLAARPKAVGRVYTLLVVSCAWVFFRAEDLPRALHFLAAMAGVTTVAAGDHPLALYSTHEALLVLALAGLGLLPVTRRLGAGVASLAARMPVSFELARIAAGALVLLLCAMSLAAGTHNPFIYFRF